MKNLKNVTELEQTVIQNIVNSEYMGATGEKIINFPVWSFSVTNSTKKLAGALGSLVKKGFAECDVSEGDETCTLTREGYIWAQENMKYLFN